MFGAPTGIGANMPAQSTAPQQPQAADDPTSIVVGPVVISYPKLFVPEINKRKPTDPPKYSGEFLVYASERAAQDIYSKLMAATQAAIQAFWPGKNVTLSRSPVRNLAEKNNQSYPPGFFFRANSPRKPSVLKGNPMVHVTDPDEIYPGAICWVQIKAAAFDTDGSKGVKFYLNSVLKAADGPRLVPERDGMADFAAHLPNIQFNLQQPGMQGMSGMMPPQQMMQPPMQQPMGMPGMMPPQQQPMGMPGMMPPQQQPMGMPGMMPQHPTGMPQQMMQPPTGMPGMMPQQHPMGMPQQMMQPPLGMPGVPPQMPGQW